MTDGAHEGAPPMHNVPIRIVAHHAILHDTLLAETSTDRDGWVDVEVHESLADLTHLRNIRLISMDITRSYDQDGTPSDSLKPLVENEIVLKLSADGTSLDFGEVTTEFWRYRGPEELAAFPLPLAYQKDSKHGPQDYLPENADCLAATKNLVGPRFLMALAHIKTSRDTVPYSTLQRSFPGGHTVTVDEERPGYSRSDAYLGERALNGLAFETLLGRDREQPELLRMKLEWEELPCDGLHDITDVDSWFEQRDDRIFPVRLDLTVRQATADGWVHHPKRSFTPDMGEDWAAAKRVWRVHYLLAGALDTHVGAHHLRVPEWSVSAHRNLRRSPIRALLEPHIQESIANNRIQKIEELCDPANDNLKFVGGPNGFILQQSALDSDTCRARLLAIAGGAHWTDWKPREPICAAHIYARSANLFWEMLTEYVDEFIAQHRDEIEEHWQEIHRFSQDLVNHSAPYQPRAEDPDIEALCSNESDTSDRPRVKFGGVTRALRPITTSDSPSSQDWVDLAQACRYFIQHASFNHSWCHRGEAEEGGEMAYCSMYLRNGSLGPESDETLMPLRKDGIQVLTVHSFGRLVMVARLNEDVAKNTPPLFLEVMERYEARFEDLGLPLREVRACLNA